MKCTTLDAMKVQDNGFTTLHVAVQHRQPELLNLRVSHVPVDTVNEKGDSAAK